MDAVHLVNLRIPALDFSQSVASGVQIIEAIARQAYLICRKAIESLQPTLTSERRAILKANRMGQIFGHLSSFPGQTSQSQLRLFGYLGFVMFCGILGILLWIIAALMDW